MKNISSKVVSFSTPLLTSTGVVSVLDVVYISHYMNNHEFII